MKSICIKTNNTKILDYIENALTEVDLDNIFFSCNEFKLYKNIIIHYKGKDLSLFYKKISDILSSLVIDTFEHNFLKKIISYNYFYFDNLEIFKILNICETLLYDVNATSDRFSLLYNSFYNYISINKNIIINGFINFRIKDYFEYLNSIVNTSVNSFIVEREYNEFISLLKMYISTQSSTCNLVHIIYSKHNSILLDEEKKPIMIDDSIFNAKYLSDISFSSNDYTLNTLLSLLPQKIYIHFVDTTLDEFINTLQLIFEDKIELCTDCNICKLYKLHNEINNFSN